MWWCIYYVHAPISRAWLSGECWWYISRLDAAAAAPFASEEELATSLILNRFLITTERQRQRGKSRESRQTSVGLRCCCS